MAFLSWFFNIVNGPIELISESPYIPDLVKISLIPCIQMIPYLLILYYLITLIERFFMKNIQLFLKLLRHLGPFFGAGIAVIPECGLTIVASTYYSRRVISRGTLLAFYISCSDDALPFLLMDISNLAVVIRLVIIKLIIAVSVGIFIDMVSIFGRKIEDVTSANIELNEYGCCHHKISTAQYEPYWWKHPFIHTFNMVVFSFACLFLIESCIRGSGGVENLSSQLLIESPIPIFVTAILGLAANCVISIFIALAYVKGIISFPALLAGMITVTGLGLSALVKRSLRNADNVFITLVLLVVGILSGLAAYYDVQLLDFFN